MGDYPASITESRYCGRESLCPHRSLQDTKTIIDANL